MTRAAVDHRQSAPSPLTFSLFFCIPCDHPESPFCRDLILHPLKMVSTQRRLATLLNYSRYNLMISHTHNFSLFTPTVMISHSLLLTYQNTHTHTGKVFLFSCTHPFSPAAALLFNAEKVSFSQTLFFQQKAHSLTHTNIIYIYQRSYYIAGSTYKSSANCFLCHNEQQRLIHFI